MRETAESKWGVGLLLRREQISASKMNVVGRKVMNYEEIDWKIEEGNPIRALLESEVSKCNSIREFVHSWLKGDSTSIVLGTGVDDDGNHTLVCMTCKERKYELAHIYIAIDRVKEEFPTVRPFSFYVQKNENQKNCPWGAGFGYDDSALNDFYETLGFQYSDDLCSDIGSLDRLIEYGMCFATDNIGEFCLEIVGESDYEEIFEGEEPEDEQLRVRTFGRSHLGYRDPETGWGCGEWKYFYFPAGQ